MPGVKIESRNANNNNSYNNNNDNNDNNDNNNNNNNNNNNQTMYSNLCVAIIRLVLSVFYVIEDS